MVVSASTLSRHVFVSLLIAIAAMVATPARAMGPDPHIVTIDDVGGRTDRSARNRR